MLLIFKKLMTWRCFKRLLFTSDRSENRQKFECIKAWYELENNYKVEKKKIRILNFINFSLFTNKFFRPLFSSTCFQFQNVVCSFCITEFVFSVFFIRQKPDRWISSRASCANFWRFRQAGILQFLFLR